MKRLIKERVAAILLAAGITVGSVFGLSSCKNKDIKLEDEDEMEKLVQVTEDEQDEEIIKLQDEINSLEKLIEEEKKQNKDTTLLEQQLTQLINKRDLIVIFNNSYKDAQYLKCVMKSYNGSEEIGNSILCGDKNKTVQIEISKDKEVYSILDGDKETSVVVDNAKREVNGFKNVGIIKNNTFEYLNHIKESLLSGDNYTIDYVEGKYIHKLVVDNKTIRETTISFNESGIYRIDLVEGDGLEKSEFYFSKSIKEEVEYYSLYVEEWIEWYDNQLTKQNSVQV